MNNNNISKLTNAMQSLTTEAQELYLPKQIDRLSYVPSPIDFLRTYVMGNLPVVIEGGCLSWPAIKKWSDEYIAEKLGDHQITVALTPNGYADAPQDQYFVLPDEQLMTFQQFLSFLQDTDDDVAYIQKQNSSFTDEFVALMEDAGADIPWASVAFNKQPDAVNFWMGSSRSITSMHKDHYENIYAVIRGSKTFILQPPTDLPCIPYEMYKLARYKRNERTQKYEIIEERNEEHCEDCLSVRSSHNELLGNSTTKSFHCVIDPKNTSSSVQSSYEKVISSENTLDCLCTCHEPAVLPWIAIDPLHPDYLKYPTYERTQQLVVTLNAGDMLYLPSLWFHHVTQTDHTIAVNYWYDMEYDIKYNYYKCIENMKNILR